MDRAQNRTQFIEQLAYSHEDPNQASKVIGAYSVRLRGALLGEMDSPERELALAVLERAVADLRSYHLARSGRRRRLYLEACRWVGSDDREWMCVKQRLRRR